jgi:hypothetical protein
MEKEVNFTEKNKIIINMVVFSQLSIFAPLLVFGSFGFWLYKKFQNPYLLLIFVFISFLVTNFLLIKRVKIFSEKMKNCSNKNLKD